VPVSGETGPTIRWARAKKRNNALTAIICGVLPATVLGLYAPTDLIHWLLGAALGLVWGNGFEYVYHRWLLHRPRSILARGHLEHHRTAGNLDQAEHITFGRSPLNVVALFLGNGLLLLPLELLFHLRIASGVLLGWAIYMITLEEIHWRIHMDGWLPPSLHFARAYHLSHHDVPNTRYNVFLPLFDFAFGNTRVPTQRVTSQNTSRPAMP